MYNKLVRDNIPDIIRANGEEPIVHVLDEADYKSELERKLLEEANEVIESGGIDRIYELADLMEVVHALLDLEEKTMEDVENARVEKASKRGGFTKRLYLEGVKEN